VPIQRYVAELFRWEKRLLARFVITALGRAAASMAIILLVRDFLGGALTQGSGLAGYIAQSAGADAALWIVAGLLLAAYVTGSLLNFDNQVCQQRIVKVLELGMMERLIRHLLRLSVPFFDRQSHGDLVQAVRWDVSNLRTIVTAGAEIVMEVLLAAALFMSALWVSPRLTFWALIVMPGVLLPVSLIGQRVVRRSYRVRATGYLLFDMVLEIARGIRIIKIFRGEEETSRAAVQKGRDYFDQVIGMVRATSLSRVILESLAGVGMVLVIVVGGFDVMAGRLGWPEFLAFLLAVRAMHNPLNNANHAYMQIKNSAASVGRIKELLAHRPEVLDPPSAARLSTAPRGIRFEKVSFSYGDRTVLRDVTFDVKLGETIGIAGPSGSGKTTLLNLIARFYDPTDGVVRFDDRSLREFRLSDVHDKIAIVTQTPFLFAASVGDNIRIGRRSAADFEVEAAARAADVHDEILALPQGYQTVIGPGGRPVSGGQAQRINLARAVLKNAPLLLLDEATSSLDSLSEARVQTTIEGLARGRTTFIVAHRLSTLRHADRILVLDGGMCVALDTHHNLLRTCDLYRRMWETQLLESPEAVATSPATSHGVIDDDPGIVPGAHRGVRSL
jgi:subfamily B ATP-binding cassette protein MsbA